VTEAQLAAKRAATKRWHEQHKKERRRYIKRWRLRNGSRVSWYNHMAVARRKEHGDAAAATEYAT
jgi:hypothetical protein